MISAIGNEICQRFWPQIIDIDNAQDLTKLVQQMLGQMQTRFTEMNDNIVDRIDEMGRKIDELENSIGELV